MNCAEYKELLVAFTEGLLNETEKCSLEKHLKVCAACRAELKEINSLRSRLINNGKILAQSDLENSVLERIIREQNVRLKTAEKAGTSLRIRRIIMKSPLTKIAVAAVIIIACVIGLSLWWTTGSGIALADVLAQIEKVEAYRFKFSTKATGEDPNKPYSFEARATILISQEYGRKTIFEQLDPNGGESTFHEAYVFPAKKTFITIVPKQKKYRRTEWDDRWAEQWQENPLTLAKQMMEYKYERLGRSTIDGIEVEGFRTTDPNYGFNAEWLNNYGAKIQADQKMWVDVKTRLPVRYDFTYVLFDQMGNKKQYVQKWYDFQWDVVIDAAEFEPVIPDDYTGTVTKYPAHITEETVIQGLKLLVELLGRYPEQLDFKFWSWPAFQKSETPAALQLKEELKGLTDEEIQNKLVDFLVPIRGLAMFYGRLQWYKKHPAYYGETVTPKDVDKVLMRWKVSENEYRVIFGDLHAEIVTPEKLAELEAALPK